MIVKKNDICSLNICDKTRRSPEYPIQNLRISLLEWYSLAKRELAWRAKDGQTPNPYYVLISEFMLQQTTVQTVIPYFENFIKVFPTLQDLANSTQEQVYHLWQGLGYYSRAKNLHRAAQQIVALGVFPNDITTLKTLSGVGDYTSAAIASIAFDQPVLPIDGNVMRVFSRLFLLDSIKGPELFKESLDYTHNFTGFSNNSESAQAIMELGALICKPKNPLCQQCPLSRDCKAHQFDRQDQYPKLPIKKEKSRHTAFSYIIEDERGHWLIIKRSSKGLFANMHIFPTTYFDFDTSMYKIKEKFTYHKKIRHIFTHLELHITIIHCSLIKTRNDTDPNHFWINPQDIGMYAMPKLMKKILEVYQCRE